MALEDRIVELETRLAFQDDTIAALNDELVAQGRRLERLQMQMAALIKRQDEVAAAMPTPVEAPPPHY